MTEVLTRPDVPGYVLDEPVGQGSGGRLWGATRLRDGLEVAIKVVRGPSADDLADTVARDLDDDFIVRIHEVVPLPDQEHALVLELLRGGTLRDVVAARGRLSPGECVTVLVPLLQVLGRLARQGIVHGDLSPDNVLFDLEGRPHLADLGGAQVVGDLPRDVVGTDGFVAPEVLLGAAPSGASDVFGVGAIGWFALVGSAPDVAQVRGQLGHALAAAAVPVPSPLVTVIEACLAPIAEDRPDPDAAASMAFDSATAEPLCVGVVGDRSGGLTRRLRAAVLADGDGSTPSGGLSRGLRRGRRLPTWAGPALLAVGLLILVGSIASSLLAQPRAQGRDRAASPTAVAGPAPASDRSASPTARSALATRQIQDPRALIQELSDLRAAAWAAPASAPWAAMTVPGSPAAGSDDIDREALVAAGDRAGGLTFTVQEATAIAAEPASAPTNVRVRARVDVSAHELVSGSGSTHRPASVGRLLDLDLRWHEGRWRLWEVTDPQAALGSAP